MNFAEIEQRLKNCLTDPKKQKTLPIKWQNGDWNFYSFDSAILALIRHFAYWLSIEYNIQKKEEFKNEPET